MPTQEVSEAHITKRDYLKHLKMFPSAVLSNPKCPRNSLNPESSKALLLNLWVQTPLGVLKHPFTAVA